MWFVATVLVVVAVLLVVLAMARSRRDASLTPTRFGPSWDPATDVTADATRDVDGADGADETPDGAGDAGAEPDLVKGPRTLPPAGQVPTVRVVGHGTSDREPRQR